MKTYKQFLAESEKTTLVLAFGRMQPPTTGHAQLVKKVKEVSKKNAAHYEIWLSATQDTKKNPLPVARKVFWAKKSFDENNIYAAGGAVKTPIDLLKSKSGKYSSIIFVAGSDRVETFQKLFDTYNGKDYTFDSIQVVSAGERDPDADDASGASGTKLRKAALANDADAFFAGTTGLSKGESAELMGELRRGLGVKEVSESTPRSLRNSFYMNEVFRVGDYISDGNTTLEILDRGTNYVTAVDGCGVLSKHFIDNVSIVEDANIPQHTGDANFEFKGFKPGPAFQANEQAVSAFTTTVERYEDGHIKDAVAILKALKAIDAFLSISHDLISNPKPDSAQKNAELAQHFSAAKSSLSRIGEFMHHMDYMDTLRDTVAVAEVGAADISEGQDPKVTDKLKIATVIADTLGADSSGSNADAIVNGALRFARKNSLLTRGESFKIIQRMLELASQVGIRYDEKILQQFAAKNESLLEGSAVKVTHDSGRVSYGKVKGQHGSVVEVSYRNGKVGFHHNHKIEQMGDEVDVPALAAKHSDLGAMQNAGATSKELHTAPGHGLRSSSLHHQHMLVKKMTE